VIGGPLGSRFGIAVTSVSPDNNTLYLIGKLQEDTPPEDRLLVTHRTTTGWSIPQPLHIDDLRPRNVYTDYSFGANQKTLLISVERDSTLGDRDLYVSFRMASGDWSTPRWLGPQVNSPYAEMTPYLASDNRTLYFSSDRPGGIGDVDVYRSTRLDDSWKNWSKPENLGEPVNRPGRTTFYTEDASGTRAYFSWSAGGNDQADIYRARIKASHAVALVRGRVLDNTGKPVAAKVYYTTAAKPSRDSSLGSATSNPQTGEYQLVLPAGQSYVMFADKEGYFVTTVALDLQSLSEYKVFDRDLILTKADVGTHISLHNILFETDRSTLLASSYAELEQVVQFLKDYPHSEILVRGHTDSTGVESHNVELSKARAEAVKQYLVAKDVAASRIQAEGKGSSQPLAPNATEEGRAQNRRVDFVILTRY
jgi:outer membrane protein OmpA-like peptidoglycan-associated protein